MAETEQWTHDLAPAEPDLLTNESALPLAAALVVGLMIGIERGWRQRGETDGTRFAGVRTFTLIDGVGGLATVVARVVSPLVSSVIVAATVAALVLALASQAVLAAALAWHFVSTIRA